MDSARAETPAERVTRLLRALSTASAVYSERVQGDVGLHRSDLGALGILSQDVGEGRPCSAGDLSVRLGLTPSAVTALIDRLEAVGHVHRRRDPLDGRRVVLELTETARTTGRAAFAPLQESVAASVEGFSEDELATAARVMTALLGGVEAATERLGHPR